MTASITLHRQGLLRILPLVLLIAPWFWPSASAQGETGPPGLEGLPNLLVMLSVYPYAAIALSYLLFKAFGRAWMFFVAPLFFVGLSFLVPADPATTDPPAPPFFSWPGVWLYWPLIVGVAIAYFAYTKTEKAWLFFLAPIVAWVIQIASLMIILILH